MDTISPARASRTLALAPVLAPLLTLLACDPSPEPADAAQPEPIVASSRTNTIQLASVALQNLTYSAEGTAAPLNQGHFPGDTELAFPHSLYDLDVTHDVAGDRIRFDRAGTNPGPGFVFDQIERIDGEIGVAEGLSALGPLGPMPSDQVAALRRINRLVNPILLLSEAASDPSIILDTDFEYDSGDAVLTYTLDDAVAPIDVEVVLNGPQAPRVRRLVTEENDLLLRDTTLEVTFDDWQLVGSFNLPHHVEVTQDGHTVRVEDRFGYAVDGPIDDAELTLPPGPLPPFDPALASVGERSAFAQSSLPPPIVYPNGRPTTLVPVEIVPGVHLLTGTLHNSMLVEQNNRLILVEAPAYPERSEEILAWVGVTFPGKDISHVVTTHFHADHTSGLRAFVANGARVVVGKEARSFIRNDVLKRDSSIVPDSLELSPVNKPKVRGVKTGEPVTLNDPVHPVTVRRVPSSHSDDMVVAYLPQDQVLFNSDMYSPGFPAGSPEVLGFAQELQDGIVAQGLNVTWMAAGHGVLVTYADFLAFLAGT